MIVIGWIHSLSQDARRRSDSDRIAHDTDAAKVTITYGDARRGQVVLDVNASEVEELAGKGTRQARRGRRPKTTP